ncbi:23S rRNA (uracil(1939)-C(5))-methyltransferase RlmD [Paraconexibacter antarcticus]|uniref:23S rRNA (Uracil(1939)-C(5))-methyltransferase RlmD n=1 Tax=Paraconexibacter antarcticus TaxID=2949664 RepID=A0ABY5DW71_9ACTN|nr:23S rRNA (uracil(1939)-C(5))-methyltransferase RlmD [Paraconexibacter antarcticus]UTI64794.1 23S rRNA (uracil(1939)-C(5))-methyltransferase RlmD [Paraconexibacter antarcticus]
MESIDQAAPAPATDRPDRPKRPDKGQELDLRIERLAHGGNGVARHDGFVVFVGGTVPGDRVRAVLHTRKKAYGEARLLEVLEPSPDRIEPVAHHPGAAWQVMPYEMQLRIKAEQVEDAMRRIGKLDGFVMEEILPAVEQWGYRNKLEYSFGNDTDGNLLCGFHAPGSWETIIDGESRLGTERANEARRIVLDWCREQGLPAYDRRSRTGVLRNLVIREARRTGQLQVRLVTSPVELDDLAVAILAETLDATSLIHTQYDGLGETTSGGVSTLLDGKDHIVDELCGLSFRISADAFFQTNTEMAERLYGVAADFADLKGWERLYDLFCGIGTIGLSLSTRSGEIWGLEIVEDAIADAIRNAKANGIDNAKFFAGDVRTALGELVEMAGRPDLLLVDPPRAGLSQKVVRRIIEANPKRIVYVSCNPTTLAPNAAQLVEAGYVLKRVRPVDMFPQTPHIEAVAVFDRG